MLSSEEVLKIAKLARLELTPEEVTLYQQRLTRVLDYMNELKNLPTEKDAFVRHIPEDAKAFRDDAIHEFAHREALLKNAPETENESFLLPTVVELGE